MSFSELDEKVAFILDAYEKGHVCSGEVTNQMIDLASDYDVEAIVGLLPRQFVGLLEEAALSSDSSDLVFIVDERSDRSGSKSDDNHRLNDARKEYLNNVRKLRRYFDPE